MSILSTGDFEKVDEHNFVTLDSNTKAFLKAVKTSCKSVGHSEEATKYARRKCFAMLDLFGPNSLFITTTPDDECGFRVRLYTKPQNWVSVKNYSKYKPIGAALQWHLLFGGRGPFGKKGCYAPRATDFREERNPPQADSIVSVLIDSKLCTIHYYNITILQYCTIL